MLVRRSGQMSRPNIRLQALMQQPWRPEASVSFVAHGHEFVLLDPFAEVLVLLLVLGDRHECQGGTSSFGRVIVPRPDLDVLRQRKEFAARGV